MKNKKIILLVEDDMSMRDALATTLRMEEYKVVLAENGRQALDILQLKKEIALIISDVQMQSMDGHELLNNCKQRHPEIPFILMTAYGTIENAVMAMNDGAIDYLVKPFKPEALVEMVKRFTGSHIAEKNTLIAVDAKSKQLALMAKKVATTDATVMISGESGVGKEIYSQYIHEQSNRADGPFVAINCAAIPENMLESVLFGYEKGAFTGAYQSKPGKFEQAQGGTLLLDEITEMDLGLQAKLLRVIQEREVERLGGRKMIPLDVRILATTNRDIHQVVNDGQFREDLFYRLNVFPLTILPLRKRVDDIMPLANKMLTAYSNNNETNYFSDSAIQYLSAYEWPGNIRELDNVIQRALILKTGEVINSDDIKFEYTSRCDVSTSTEINDEATSDTGLNNDLKAHETDLIISALKTKNSRTEVAEKLGISPRTLRYKLAKLRNSGIALPA